MSRFKDECYLMTKLRHPHIVQFLGIYFDPGTHLPALVTPVLSHSAWKATAVFPPRYATRSYATWRWVCAISTNTVRVSFTAILSANNVLLTADMVAKISDMGGAKIDRYCRTQTPGTQSYLAPETMCSNPYYSTEVDVFSFGVMLVHVLSGHWPLPMQ